MALDRFLEWRVAPEGYRWIDTREQNPFGERTYKGYFLTDGREINRDGVTTLGGQIFKDTRNLPEPPPYSFYEPEREYPNLFREFSAIEVELDAIAAFASKYGFLGIGKQIEIVVDDAGSRYLAVGELLQDWVEEIRAVHTVLKTWDLLNDVKFSKVSETELRKHIDRRPPEDQKRVVVTDKGPMLLRPGDNPEAVWAKLPPGTITRMALRQLKFEIDKKLRQLVNISLMLNEKNGKFITVNVTHTLLGVLWLQVAQTVTEQRRINYCRVCGKPIEVSKFHGRADKELCGATCRKRFSRAGGRLRVRRE